MFKIFAVLLFLSISSASHGMTSEQWHQLSFEKKIEFHYLLLQSLSESDSKTPFNMNLYTFVKEVFRGIASKKSCIYGGWVSTTTSGVCRHPFRGNKEYQVCGLKGVHRCNPIFFGDNDEKSFAESKKGRGVCVEAHGDSSSMTWACIKSAYGPNGNIDVERFRDYLKTLEGNSRYLGEYLIRATEIVEDHCSENSDDFCAQNLSRTHCERLRRSFFEKTSANPALIACRSKHEILLESGNDSLEENRKILEVYFPLIEESQSWKKIKETALASEILKDKGFWPHRCNPYDIIESNRPGFKELGRKPCSIQKNILEETIAGQTPWGKMSLGERAERIYRLSQESHADIKNYTQGYVSKSGTFSQREKSDGNVFHRDINPAMATCFIYHETEGSLNPFIYNYTYCHRKTRRSTAYGLGQITRLTLKDIVEINSRNLPFVTPEAKKFTWPGYSEEPMSGEDIHRYMSFSPKFQTELVLRILNRKAKIASSEYGLGALVGGYLGCNNKESCKKKKKRYVDNVQTCIKCFREGRSASDCYYVLEKCQSQDCREARDKGEFSP